MSKTLTKDDVKTIVEVSASIGFIEALVVVGKAEPHHKTHLEDLKKKIDLLLEGVM